MTRWVKWSDPKLEPYREKNAAANVRSGKNSAVKKFAKRADLTTELAIPTSQKELIEMMRVLPKSVLSTRERAVIATAMAFPQRKVQDIMLPKTEIIYVAEDEVLGPLTLDRLYRSGFSHFPVINQRKEIIGLLHTDALNSLEIRETSRAREILDKNVCYLRDDYTLYEALAAFYRTNCQYFLVVDPFERIVGLLTYQMLTELLLGEAPQDDFDRDRDRAAVARRRKDLKNVQKIPSR